MDTILSLSPRKDKVGVVSRVTVPAMVALALLLAQNGLAAQDSARMKTRASNAFRFDNGVLVGTDRGYTGGLMVGWSSGEHEDPGVLPVLGWLGFDREFGKRTALSLTFGHSVYTPDSLSWTEPAAGDRPYAGIL